MDPKRGRLTWDVALLRPFESAWSIFTRICVLNNLTQIELDRLISLSCKTRLSQATRFTTSTWIDFEKFSRILRVDSGFLKQGFLDQFGFYKRSQSVYGVRHCEECWRSAYHCPFFDLAIVGYCPWHGTKLSEPCIGCANVMRQNVAHVMSEQIIECPECGRLFPNAFNLIKEVSLQKKRKEIPSDVYCRSLISWKHTVVDRIGKQTVLDVLGNFGTVEQELSDDLPWQLGRAIAAAGHPDGWQWSVQPIPVKVSTPCMNLSLDQISLNVNENGENKAIWKALRRHIYRKYLLGHRKCLGQLNCLHGETFPALTGSVCTAGLAYLLWQMKLNNVCNIDGLSFPAIQSRPKSLIEPPLMRHGLREEALFTYAVFFGLWLELSLRCGKENFYVNFSPEWLFKYVECVEASEFKAKAESPYELGTRQRVLVSFPDDANLVKDAFNRCRQRCVAGETMIHEDFVETFLGWTRHTGRFRRKMFYVGASQLNNILVAKPMMV